MGSVDGAGSRGVVRAWARYDVKNNVVGNSRHLSSITDGGTGQVTFNWDISFSATDYSSVIGTSYQNGVLFNAFGTLPGNPSQTVSATTVQVRRASDGALVETDNMNVAILGDLA